MTDPVTAHPIDTEALRKWIESQRHHEGVTLHVSIESAGALLDLLAAAEHRATRAEAERDEWRQTAVDERGAALDALEQIKAREARIKAVKDVLDA